MDSAWHVPHASFLSVKKAFCNQAGTDAISVSYALELSGEVNKHLLCLIASSSPSK